VVQRLIRRVGQTDQAFRLGDGLAAPVLDVLQVRRFLGRFDHPELIWRRGISAGLSRRYRQTITRGGQRSS